MQRCNRPPPAAPPPCANVTLIPAMNRHASGDAGVRNKAVRRKRLPRLHMKRQSRRNVRRNWRGCGTNGQERGWNI